MKTILYVDHIENYIPIVNAQQAAKIVMKAFHSQEMLGPSVFASLDQESNAILWFYKDKDSKLNSMRLALNGEASDPVMWDKWLQSVELVLKQ